MRMAYYVLPYVIGSHYSLAAIVIDVLMPTESCCYCTVMFSCFTYESTYRNKFTEVLQINMFTHLI